MHPEAFAWVATQVRRHGPFTDVVEFGSRDVNGSVRCLFPAADYVGIDIAPGPGVDHVGNAADYQTLTGHDCCLCLETLEHTPDGEQIIKAASMALRPGGVLVVTAACDPRAPHSAIDGGPIHADEHYQNVDPGLLRSWMADLDEVCIEVHERGDVYACAVKRGESDRRHP